MPAADQLAAARFLAISRFKARAPGDRSSIAALARNASRPPRRSSVRSAEAATRSRTDRFNSSDWSVTLHRFGKNLRLVLRFEWLTLWPLWTAFPVSSQRRLMVLIQS